MADDEGTATCVDILIAILLPPLGVFAKYACGVEFWICLVLTLFGYLPGIIYAVYAITKFDAEVSLISLARDNNRYEKLIIEEEGAVPLLKFV